MAGKIFQMLPVWVKDLFMVIINSIRHIPFAGKGRHCPVCGRDSKKFGSFGTPPRDDAQCMYCGALERHRFIWLYFCRFTDLFTRNGKILHVAPELCLGSSLQKRLRGNYFSADLMSPRAMIKMDITDIQFPDAFFDVIYCSHVLEHVLDDKKALREFFRVLKPDGWAILLVPIFGEKTIEDTRVTEPAERLRLFGQEDHVRIYGRDYIDRLREAGFTVKIESAPDLFSLDDIHYMGLTVSCGDIYFCSKKQDN
jgi:SAM-dependent methyltransferase